MKIGYARVPTDEQNLDLHIDVLTAAGCEAIYTDEEISGIIKKRNGLSQALSAIEKKDVLVIWKLDRLGALKYNRANNSRGRGKSFF